jgi:hypothetical protein
MDKTKFTAVVGLRLPFSTDALHFNLTCVAGLSDCATRLRKISVTQPSTEIDYILADSEIQRFHLQTRHYRVHLLEADGYLKRIDDNNTQVTGEVVSHSIASVLFAVMFVVIGGLSVALANILIIVIGLVTLCLLGLYCNHLVENAHHEQRELVKHIEAMLTAQ